MFEETNIDDKLNFDNYKVISYVSKYDYSFKVVTSVIIEDNRGDYLFITDDRDKIKDVLQMPYYIKEDWINYNKKSLNIKTINEHIKNLEENLIRDLNNLHQKKMDNLKSIRRDLIIKDII